MRGYRISSNAYLRLLRWSMIVPPFPSLALVVCILSNFFLVCNAKDFINFSFIDFPYYTLISYFINFYSLLFLLFSPSLSSSPCYRPTLPHSLSRLPTHLSQSSLPYQLSSLFLTPPSGRQAANSTQWCCSPVTTGTAIPLPLFLGVSLPTH